MNILLFLIPISLVMIGAAALLFAWAVRHGQFDDLDTPALDILRDDVPPARAPAGPEAHPVMRKHDAAGALPLPTPGSTRADAVPAAAGDDDRHAERRRLHDAGSAAQDDAAAGHHLDTDGRDAG